MQESYPLSSDVNTVTAGVFNMILILEKRFVDKHFYNSSGSENNFFKFSVLHNV